MIAIIDYKTGNIGSILNMIKKIGGQAVVTNNNDVIRKADKLILPGVGSFDAGMHNLIEEDLIEILNEQVLILKKPILGICLGMQLLGTRSEEGVAPGLGWIDFKSQKFNTEKSAERLRLPHMGWNVVRAMKSSALLENLDPKARFYFVHSYHAVCNDQTDELLETEYGYPFISAVQRDNIYGVQFHPEKSHQFGLALLKNFVERC